MNKIKVTKKVIWNDPSVRPPDNLISKLSNKGRKGKEVRLLVLCKGIPYPMFGVFRSIQVFDKETSKVDYSKCYWQLLGVQHSEPATIVAWRKCPDIPEEYYEILGIKK
jgi:hypothetical protein